MEKEHQRHICKSIDSTYNLDEGSQRQTVQLKQQNNKMEDQGETPINQACNQSIENICSVFQTSFQKDLLKQHVKVASNYLPQLLRFDFHFFENSPFSQLQCCHAIQLGDQQAISFITGEFLKLYKNEKRREMKYSQVAVNLMAFLGKMVKIFKPFLFKHIINLTYEVWSRYLKIQDDGQDLPKLVTKGIQIADSITNQWKSRLCFSENVDSFRYSLRIYCTTVLLVVNQYFQNPHFEEFSTAFHDSSESDFSPDKIQSKKLAKPHKKRHENSSEDSYS